MFFSFIVAASTSPPPSEGEQEAVVLTIADMKIAEVKKLKNIKGLTACAQVYANKTRIYFAVLTNKCTLLRPLAGMLAQRRFSLSIFVRLPY